MHKSLSRNIGFEQSHIRGTPEIFFVKVGILSQGGGV